MRKFGFLAALVMVLAWFSAGAQAPGPYAAYVGKWQGSWKGGLATSIDIQRIDADGTMHGVSSWGDKPEWHVKAGSAPFNVTKISPDGKFSVPDTSKPGARMDWAYKDGKFQGWRFETPNGKATNTATLVKAK